MGKGVKRAAAVMLGASLGGVAAAPVASMLAPETALPVATACGVRSDVPRLLNEEAPARDELVAAELVRVGKHPWAGEFRTRFSPMGSVLRLAPDAGFTLYQETHCGNCSGWRGLGRVVSANGPDLTLEVELGYDLSAPEDGPRAADCFEQTLHMVRWGDLLFAVAPWQMEEFCANASDGYSFPSVPFRYAGDELSFGYELAARRPIGPESLKHFPNLVRTELITEFDYKHAPRPEGAPEVPPQYRHLIPNEPITTKVAALVEWRPRPSSRQSEWKVEDVVYSLDAGAEDGVAIGMRFFLEGERANRTGRIEHVDAHTSRAVFIACEEDRARAVTFLGKRASTLHPKSGLAK